MGKTSNPTSPHHYSRWKIQPLRFCRENRIDFVRGNCLKYLLRHDEKDGLQDLKKAFVYFMQHALEAYGPAACAEILATPWDVCDSKEVSRDEHQM